MKGPGDWLSVLEALDLQSIPFRATWIGDGPDLARMQERVARSGLTDQVVLHGFEGNRAVLLRAMRESDLLLFCHKTPESPRCLIEALVSGCPLVGYETAYPKGLVDIDERLTSRFDAGLTVAIEPPELEMRVAILPRAEVIFDDGWYVQGLKATGSYDYHVQDLLVPEARTFPLFTTEPLRGSSAAFRMGMMPVTAAGKIRKNDLRRNLEEQQ